MAISEKQRTEKKLLIKTARHALGLDGEAYRSFLAEKTGKRQLARMTDYQLDIIFEALKVLLDVKRAGRAQEVRQDRLQWKAQRDAWRGQIAKIKRGKQA